MWCCPVSPVSVPNELDVGKNGVFPGLSQVSTRYQSRSTSLPTVSQFPHDIGADFGNEIHDLKMNML